MSTYTTGYDEQYKCFHCNKIFNDSSMASSASWKCPDCGEYIRIAAPDLNTGHTLIRKLVTELRIIDSVHMLGSENTYTTIDIKKLVTIKSAWL